MMLTPEEIIQKIPQQPPFRFIDAISFINSEKCSGQYTFREDEYFLSGHFPGHPVVPGFIVNECMAQIGLVAFGIYLLTQEPQPQPALTPVLCDAQCNYLKPVYPGDTLYVTAEKIYFRLHKLRCNIVARNAGGETCCAGVFSGIHARI